MLSHLLAISEMFRRPNLFLFLNLSFTLFSHLIIFSRTPLILIFFTDIAFAFLFVVTMRKKYRRDAALVLSVTLAGIALLLLLFLFHPDVARFWKDAIRNHQTIAGRGIHIISPMLSSPATRIISSSALT